MTEYLVPGQPNGGLAENCMIGELQVVYSTLLNSRKSKVQYSQCIVCIGSVRCLVFSAVKYNIGSVQYSKGYVHPNGGLAENFIIEELWIVYNTVQYNIGRVKYSTVQSRKCTVNCSAAHEV